jgi:hypothetical protein
LPAEARNADRKQPAFGERDEYLIDGFRVTFLHQAEWRCACREFSAAGTCRHTREAGGMRAAQALIRRRSFARVSEFPPYATENQSVRWRTARRAVAPARSAP